MDVIRAARKKLSLADSKEYPSIAEIYSACLGEVEERRRSKNPVLAPKGTPEPHECGPPAKHGPALGRVRLFLPYEAAHMLCPETIKATCPVCGERYGPAEMPFIEILAKDFPDEVKGWNTNMKGYLLCEDCAIINKSQTANPSPRTSMPKSLS